MQSVIPISVGMTAARSVHFILPVSFFIVIKVVEHGQCIREKMIVFIAVTKVQPLASNISLRMLREGISLTAPSAIYDITMRGRTISFAGRPKMKAIRIVPSNPISLPNGSKKEEKRPKMV